MSGEGRVVAMERWAADGTVRARPPLEPARLEALATGDAGDPGTRLEAHGVVGLLTIRADPARIALAGALESVLGLALPGRLSSTVNGDLCLRWMSPDEWLLSCPAGSVADVETRLRAALDGHVAMTDVSGGWCVLALEGPRAREVLAKSTSLDVDPRAFPVGRVASTVFAKSVATLRRVDDARWELICRRSFADYVALWLASAAREHGLATSSRRAP